MENLLNKKMLSLFRCCLSKIVLCSMLFLIADAAFCQGTSQNKVTQIRQQMAKIRQTTNWDNPAEAKKANAQIKVLMGQLVVATSASSNNQGKAGGQNQGGTDDSNPDGNVMSELQMEMGKHKVDVYNQIWEAGSVGKSAPVLLAKPLREEIIQEFKDDESSEVKNADWLESMPYLLINVSMPGVQAVIDQMPAFMGIKVLVITCDKRGTIVDLNNILTKAKDYPLEELHILNFGATVSTLPSKIGDFASLKKLSLLNNNIQKLPSSVAKLAQLEILYTDLNPIQSISQEVGNLKELKQLGISKTKIPETEISRIKQTLPNCKILR